MNIFNVRTFNPDEQAKIKAAVEDAIECMNQINDLTEHMNEQAKDVCESLNTGIKEKELKIKPAFIKKLAKTKMKEDLAKQKAAVSELADALKIVFNEEVIGEEFSDK